MSRSATARGLARRLLQTSAHSSAPQTRCAALRFTHPFSTSAPLRDDVVDQDISRRKNVLQGIGMTARPPPPPKRSGLSEMAKAFAPHPNAMATQKKERHLNLSFLEESVKSNGDPASDIIGKDRNPEPYHFHIYSHKHNTHVTVTKPNRDPIISLSCGNLGFRKSSRKQYDAAYQLGAYVVDKLQQRGLHNEIHKMEVSLRGFGAGREAVTKVLMGTEGSLLRAKISKVSDSTKLKFGGTRSKAPRRL